MFLRDCWYVAAEAAEVGRTPLGRILLGEPVVLYRRENGAAVALEDRCCHRRAPLHKGRLVGDALQCGYHGFTFDATGACIAVPGYDRLPFRGVGVRAYPLVERYRYLWIWMGEAAKADPGLIPDFHHNDDPAWAAPGERLPVGANYLLLVENLIDLSHVAFVHVGTIGSDDTKATLDHQRGEGFVRVVRDAKDIPTPPHMRRLGLGERADMNKAIEFRPPSTVTIRITWTQRGVPNPRTMHVMVLNAITPETERSCHYFWVAARDFDIADGQVTEFYRREVIKAFNEDKDMLEAQQAVIELAPDAPTINVHADWGGVQARRLVDQRIAGEAHGTIAAQ
jgi:vanillate O-demethylase monooxygenase subunit